MDNTTPMHGHLRNGKVSESRVNLELERMISITRMLRIITDSSREGRTGRAKGTFANVLGMRKAMVCS